MKLFITGEQESEFIKDTLNELEESFGITCVIGSACSPCMNDVSQWCEENEVPINLQLPECFDELGLIECNLAAIKNNNPQFLMIYTDTEAMIEAISELASVTPSVQYIARKE